MRVRGRTRTQVTEEVVMVPVRAGAVADAWASGDEAVIVREASLLIAALAEMIAVVESDRQSREED